MSGVRRGELVGQAEGPLAAAVPVLIVVGAHVAHSVAHLGGRLEDVRVVAVGEDGTVALHQPVERLGDPDRQASKREWVVPLV